MSCGRGAGRPTAPCAGEVQLGHLRLEVGHELDRGGARADHRDALAVEGVLVVPLRGVEDHALERADALYIGQLRRAQRAGAGDEDLSGEGARVRLDAPVLGPLLPGGGADLDS